MKKSYWQILFLSTFLIKAPTLFALNDTTHFVSTWNTLNSGVSNSKSITIATDDRYEYDFDIDWNNDGIFDDFHVQKTISHEYDKGGEYTIRIRGKYPRIAFERPLLLPIGDQLKLTSVDQWGTNVWQDMSYAFAFCENLQIYAEDTPNLTEATDLSYLFANATFFMGDLEKWDVSSVTHMEGMFLNTEVFNSDLFYWDVSSVISMRSMFQGALAFNQDLYYWEIGRVEDLSFMFKDAISFNGDIRDWNVYNAEYATGMFLGCESFDRRSISSWNFSGDIRRGTLYNSGFSGGNYGYYGYGLGITGLILETAFEIAFYTLLFSQ